MTSSPATETSPGWTSIEARIPSVTIAGKKVSIKTGALRLTRFIILEGLNYIGISYVRPKTFQFIGVNSSRNQVGSITHLIVCIKGLGILRFCRRRRIWNTASIAIATLQFLSSFPPPLNSGITSAILKQSEKKPYIKLYITYTILTSHCIIHSIILYCKHNTHILICQEI